MSHSPIALRHQISPFHLFKKLPLGRLRFPFQITDATCEGRQVLVDTLGHHKAWCMRRGSVKRRATPTKRMTGRAFCEAGACVRRNAFLRDVNVNVPAQDPKCTVDITLRRVPSCHGEAHPHADDHNGTVLLQTRLDKETSYPELASSRPLQTRGSRHRDGWMMERGGCADEDVGTLPSTGRPVLHAVPRDPHVGTKVDQNVGHRLRGVLRRISGRTRAEFVLVSH